MPPHEQHPSKKRKLGRYGDGADLSDTITTFRPSARFAPTVPRDWTVSVAIPSSIITDCARDEQRINAPSRIARALAVFSIDEVVVFDDSPHDSRPPAVDTDAYTGDVDPAHYIWHLLNYMECPPFMRKTLFPLHPNLRLQGLFPGLDMPHHPHRDEWLPYMEAMTLPGKPEGGNGTLVDIGMRKPITIAESIPPKTRLTLRFPGESYDNAEAVDPAAPRTEGGYYWGFGVRRCASLSEVLTESPFEGGYDLSIGTSERGDVSANAFPHGKPPPQFKHLLIVFGGPRGLEFAAMNDPQLSEIGIGTGRVREVFDHWINVLPDQGSRNIKTEESLFIALTDLRRLWYRT
ncbi:hypothetical protein MCOR27_003407 [Pyricularia oryzae]|uniref:Deoxyribose-phosphate aldolase n=2 Tax=Pyricularia TaxID=48558 RepID=A0ABQ8NNQ3_PYRGI|nr:hypothetical protein MCOR01_009865 [Pyricularia oryzae]KAI6299899.1 hypothetical protein MCOR33_004287 [Pyricularia grisea]KAH9436836.1 hypothetical protein MCOR02_000499 [Pyricularia oryzae]KAI6263253.1 hypothetical protein MCOR19_000578 [Pyricularia oryzae]KAI6273262.1 hypothetical protein MCOR26_006981 [Pyricularia oryzae]